MANKERLELILAGKVPDIPPHFELDFHLAKEMFGLDLEAALEAVRSPTATPRNRERFHKLHIEVQVRLVEELGYASAFSNACDPERDIAELKKAVGGKALVRTHEGDGVFWMPTGDDIMDFVVRMFERPDEMHAEARRKCNGAKKLLKRHADAGADFFVLCYDFGFNRGPFVSPDQFREFVTPYLTEIVETVHDLGKKAVLHSDGDLSKLLDQIHSTGVDGYHSVDPQGNMDIKAVRETYPDWILMGNVNCGMLQDANEERIREAVRYCMQHGGVGKRYIFSTSNCIYPDMPVESYRIMLDEYHRLAAQSRAP